MIPNKHMDIYGAPFVPKLLCIAISFTPAAGDGLPTTKTVSAQTQPSG